LFNFTQLMKLRPAQVFLLLALLCSGLPGYAQKHFDSVLNELDTKYPQEKLYLHFDRALYNPGETIWFKAYLFSGAYPSQLSKTIYAELLDEQGKLLQRKSAPVALSGSAAAFDLPANLTSPVVYVRAYTRWMLNFDTSFIFVKPIPIALKTKTTSPASGNTPSAFLQFFPEGGNLVAGLSSKIAFKATDAKGFPIAVKGDIITTTGKKITSFASTHNGMGYFMLQPTQGETYKATWKDAAGKAMETSLPSFLSSGVVINVENLGNKIDFSIDRTPDSKFTGVYVVAQLHQQLLYRARANLVNKTNASGSIPLEGIPAGIVQITLFTEDSKPIAERIVFVNQDDYYFITDLNAATKNLSKRAKNVIQIDVPDTIACNLSVSVTDAGLNPPIKGEDDIFSHILLTSDIKGYVHEPGYYFSGVDSAMAHLDLVMMTNGWRRYKWDDILAGRFPTLKHEAENYLAVQGKVSGINSSELAQKDLTGMLETKNGGRYFLNIPVKRDGTFAITDVLFFDTARIYYQFNNDKDKVLTTRGVFEFRNNLYNQPLRVSPVNERFILPAKADESVVARNTNVSTRRLTQEEEMRRRAKTLATVEVKAQQKTKQQKMNDQYTSGLFSGDGTVFITEDDPFAASSQSVFTYLQGRVAGLRIGPSSGGVAPELMWRGGPPSLFLDEMQMDANALVSIPMSDVAMIKVFNPPFFGGFGGSTNGAIAVYTKKGSNAMAGVKGLDAVNVVGYSPVKEFYSPDYSKYEPSANDQEDYRSTLYWNPFVMTHKQNRRILITFYNNDITRKLRVVIEGINMDGKLTRIEKIFE